MSVVGIDLGNMNTVVAVARNRGIDVICNEVSNRLTPTMLSFGAKARHIGEAGKTLEISNFRNTVCCIKRLLGQRMDDPRVQKEAVHVNFALVADETGLAAAQVEFQGETRVFSMVQLMGMYLGKLREITEVALESAVRDVVISVPVYYTDMQRRAMLDAAEIAGLNALRLVNETTAAGIAYGIPKSDLPEEKPRFVCLVDIGQSATSVAVCALTRGRLEIKSQATDEDFGGRDIDEALTRHFVADFGARYKIDLATNSKAVYRLRAACEKAKRVLSANLKTFVSVENLMEDKDVSCELHRHEMETICADMFGRVVETIRQALGLSGMLPSDIATVELIGGTTRVPAIRSLVASFFPASEPASTLNQDEAVARGCAFQCAIISPTFKVREFSVVDYNPAAIRLAYADTSEDPEDTEIVVFPAGCAVPATKLLTFSRRQDFSMVATVVHSDAQLGRFDIRGVRPAPDGKAAAVRIKVRLNPSGLLGVEGAHLLEQLQSGSSDTEQTSIKTKKIELCVDSMLPCLSRQTIAALRQLETEFVAHDKLVADTENAKNALEEYIYDLRAKLDTIYVPFVAPDRREAIRASLQEAEDWLYSDGWESTKSVYVSRLGELKTLGTPIQELYSDSEALESAVRAFRSMVSKMQPLVPDVNRQPADREIKAKLDWLQSALDTHSAAPKTSRSALTAAAVHAESEKLSAFLASLVGRKPDVVQSPKPAHVAVPEETVPIVSKMDLD